MRILYAPAFERSYSALSRSPPQSAFRGFTVAHVQHCSKPAGTWVRSTNFRAFCAASVKVAACPSRSSTNTKSFPAELSRRMSWSEMLLMQIRMFPGSGGVKCPGRRVTTKGGCFASGCKDDASSISNETGLDSIRRLVSGSNSATFARYLRDLLMSNRSPSKIICSALLSGGISIIETAARKLEELQLGSGGLGGGLTSPAESKTSTPVMYSSGAVLGDESSTAHLSRWPLLF